MKRTRFKSKSSKPEPVAPARSADSGWCGKCKTKRFARNGRCLVCGGVV